MHEIKIYGEIVPFEEDWIIEQGGYVNLSSVQNQLKKAEGKDLYVKIRSFGGCVETGFSIYSELRRYAKDNNAKVTILGEGQIASIATVIFLAGDERILTGHTEPFVHNAWTYEMGDSKKLMRVSLELEKCNNMIADHYALHTDLTKDEALALMDAETSITAEEAVKIRFATSIEEILRPVALKRFSINKKDDKMNKQTQTLLNKAKNFLKGFKNKMEATADGADLDFYELEDEATVEVGAKATFDGADADGSFVMATGETYVFVAGELTEIIPVEDEMTIEEAKAEIEALRGQLEAVTNKAVELDTQNKSNIALIASYKASSKPAPKAEKESPKAKQDDPKETSASKAVSNFNKFKTK